MRCAASSNSNSTFDLCPSSSKLRKPFALSRFGKDGQRTLGLRSPAEQNDGEEADLPRPKKCCLYHRRSLDQEYSNLSRLDDAPIADLANPERSRFRATALPTSRSGLAGSVPPALSESSLAGRWPTAGFEQTIAGLVPTCRLRVSFRKRGLCSPVRRDSADHTNGKSDCSEYTVGLNRSRITFRFPADRLLGIAFLV
jgi:hypothetical protein